MSAMIHTPTVREWVFSIRHALYRALRRLADRVSPASAEVRRNLRG